MHKLTASWNRERVLLATRQHENEGALLGHTAVGSTKFERGEGCGRWPDKQNRTAVKALVDKANACMHPSTAFSHYKRQCECHASFQCGLIHLDGDDKHFWF